MEDIVQLNYESSKRCIYVRWYSVDFSHNHPASVHKSKQNTIKSILKIKIESV